MTIESVFAVVTEYRRILSILALAIPVVAFVISWMHGVYQGREAPWRQFYALLLHLSTVLVATIVAFFLFFLYQGGSFTDDAVPRIVIVATIAGWALTILFVKRVVDFPFIRTVRSPLGLLIAWLLAWSAGFVVYVFDLALIPGPEYVTMLAAILVVFLVFRALFRVFARER